MDSTDSTNSAVQGTCGCANEYFGFINHVMDFLLGEQLSASDRLYAWSASKLFNYLGRGERRYLATAAQNVQYIWTHNLNG